VQGKVKWFSEENGYGYIVGDDGNDYHFNIREVQGANLPCNGDTVNYKDGLGKKGPRATSIVITAKSPVRGKSSSNNRPDDRATCSHCGKMMVPRIIVSHGRPQYSMCPFCGRTYKNFGRCYIATAVYGDCYAPEVIALRRFRDETLAQTAVGRVFIRFYYRVSPPLAALLSRQRALAAFVRLFLNILVRRNS